MKKNKFGNENDRGITMSGVKRICKTVGKIAFSVVVGVGLIGFVKGLIIGYYIGLYKAKSSWQHKM
jgi:hypothetical protein